MGLFDLFRSKSKRQHGDSDEVLAKYQNFKGISTQVKTNLKLLLSGLEATPADMLTGELTSLKSAWSFARSQPFEGDLKYVADLLFRCLEEDERWAKGEVAKGEMKDYGFQISYKADDDANTALYVQFLVFGYPTDFFLGHAVRKGAGNTYHFVHHKDGIAEML